MIGKNRPDDDGSTRITGADRAHGTTSDADVTSRMTGTTPRHAATDRDHDGVPDRFEHDTTRRQGVVTDASRPAERYEERTKVKSAKTSAAAVFALVFGLAALFCALTAILAPAAVVFGLIGIVLAFVGFKMARRLGVTGKGVAAGGLITSLLGLLLGAGLMAGAAVFVNDESNLDRLQGWIDDARDELPSGNEVVEQVPGN